MKRILSAFGMLLFLSGWHMHAQDTLFFRSDHPMRTFKWVVLHKLEGGEMLYIRSVDSIPPEGVRLIVKDLPYGEYALQYDTRHLPGLRFIYEGENVRMTFDPARPEQPKVEASESNKVWYDFLTYNRRTLRQLRRLKKAYDRRPSDSLQRAYARIREAYHRHTDSLSAEYRHKAVGHFIAGSRLALPLRLYPSREEYIRDAETHFFERLDVNDTVLYHSHVLYDRLHEYVFRIPVPAYGAEKSAAYVRRLDTVFHRLTYMPARASLLKTFLTLFAMEDAPARERLEKLYRRLPEAYRTPGFLENLHMRRFPVRGEKFDWDYLKQQTDASPGRTPYTLLVFFSSSCPHCQHQLPKLYDYWQKNRLSKTFSVVTVGLEEDPRAWKSFVAPFKGWKNVYLTGEAMMDTAVKYAVEFTPTYILIDKEGKIVEKTPGGTEIFRILQYFTDHGGK
ncbi:MAG: TlpA family protein disulfide reductase [Chlorobi bacterium]|nr:TlpA family protein disulfide reductase [Chlorobiota bacterium]